MKLHIAIPTYNRALYLARSVSSIASQIHYVTKDDSVDIVIYDNASTDNTALVCEELQKKFPFIQVIRHPINIGGDANILQAIQSSVADYTWVFGDDDYLLNDSLCTVFYLLKKSKCCLLKLSTIEERDTGSLIAKSSIFDTSKHIVIPDTVELDKYNSADEILLKFGLGMGNFTSLIIANSFFYSNYSACADDLFASGYSQLIWIYKGLVKLSNEFCFLNHPVVCIRIEMKPRGLDPDKICSGICLLEKSLLELGYSIESVAEFSLNQRSANYLAFVKQEKFEGRLCSLQYLKSGSNGLPFSVMLKAFLISLLPSYLFVLLWHYKK